jgi:hypothetical protein
MVNIELEGTFIVTLGIIFTLFALNKMFPEIVISFAILSVAPVVGELVIDPESKVPL